MFFVFLFSAILLLPEYQTRSRELHKGKRLFDPHDSMHPFSPFYRR